MISIIEKDGYIPTWKIISKEKLKLELKKKLREEAREVFFSLDRQNLLEELADTYQVLTDLTKESGFLMVDLIQEVNRKFKERGGFRKGVFLIEVN